MTLHKYWPYLQKVTLLKYWPIWFEHCGFVCHACLPYAAQSDVIYLIGKFNNVFSPASSCVAGTLLWPDNAQNLSKNVFNVENIILLLNTKIHITVTVWLSKVAWCLHLLATLLVILCSMYSHDSLLYWGTLKTHHFTFSVSSTWLIWGCFLDHFLSTCKTDHNLSWFRFAHAVHSDVIST